MAVACDCGRLIILSCLHSLGTIPEIHSAHMVDVDISGRIEFSDGSNIRVFQIFGAGNQFRE